jgi:hypothetical protein
MEERPQTTGRILLHGRQHVRVDAERHLDALVSKTLLHHLRRYASFEHERGGRVSKPVQRDRPHGGRLDDPGELALPEVDRLEREAQRILAAVRAPCGILRCRWRPQYKSFVFPPAP